MEKSVCKYFHWKYLTGLISSNIILKRYQDEATGAIKEEFIRAGSKHTEYLFYVPGDKFTFTSEKDLHKRIRKCQSTKQK